MRHTAVFCLVLSLLLTGCATVAPPVQDEVKPPAHSGSPRALYLYSRARLAAVDGDYQTAMTLLADAITNDPSSAYLHQSMAEVKIKADQIDEGMAYIERAIQLDPDFRDPYMTAGAVMAASGRDKEAVGFLRNAVRLAPDKEDAYLHLAVSLTRIMEYEEAVDTLKALVKRSPESVMGHYYLGRAYGQMRLYRDAITYFSKTLELRPEMTQAAIDMAASYEALNEYAQAIDVYKAQITNDESKSSILQRLIQLLIQQRRFPEALEYLRVAAKTGAGGQEVMRKIGLVHLELEQFDDAIGTFSELLAKDPDAHVIRLYLGIAFEEKGNLERAREEFMKIPPTSQPYVEAAGHLAAILREQNKNEEAVKLLQDASAANPGQVEFILNLSSMYESMGHIDDARKLLLDAEPSFPREPRLQFRLGVIFDKTGQRTESIERMKRVLTLNPHDAQAMNFLGYTYAELESNLDEALKLLKQAIAIRPNDGFFMDSLGWVYFKMKKYDEAVRYLKMAIELVEDDSTISEHLGDVYNARHDAKNALKQYKRALELDPERKELQEKVRKLKGEPADR